jgi:hypothetical protein
MGDAALMELEESIIYGLWPKRLRIFEDRIETQDFVLLREETESNEYGSIDSVTVSGEGLLVNLLIKDHRGKPVLLMRGLNGDTAQRAKALIEERMARARGRSPRIPG